MNNEEHEYQQETNYEYQLRVIEEMRKVAYADPQTGSDRHFAEASRLEAEGDTAVAEDARAAGLARYEEIKASLPWPAGD